MTRMSAVAQLAVLVTLPAVVVGVINRTKAVWSGRRGPPILQLLYDVVRLLRKQGVYSAITTAVFGFSPWIVLATGVAGGLIAPVLAAPGPASFSFEFVVLAYVWGLGRVALMLGALDTGSSFEGLGASREALFSALLEPVFFLVSGAACLLTGQHSFAALLELRPVDPVRAVAWVATIVCLFIFVQVESSRMPVDDPSTHLELTMVHEVMVLDHSGPDLAALLCGSAIKLTVGLGLIATVMNPLVGHAGMVAVALLNIGLILVLAISIGTVESLVARLKLRAVPKYVVVGLAAAGVALLATTFRGTPG